MPTVALEQLFGALADRTRLRLLNLMATGEVCVCFLVEVIGAPQPKVSRHLAHLRQAGLVEARRDGKWIHYRIARKLPSTTRRILEVALGSLEEEGSLRQDRTALLKACCSTTLPETLRRAPKPQLGSG